MPEVSLCAGEQRWSQMVSVVQSVWSLNKYRALLPDLMPSWGEVVGRGCACSAGFLSWPVSWHWCAWGGKRRGTGDGGVQTLQQWLAAVWPWVSEGLPEQSSRTGFSCQRGPGLSARCGGDRLQVVSNQSLMASPVTAQLCSVTSLL